MDFSGLVILITGASRGIGFTLANIFHEYGATVIGIYHKNVIKNVLFDTYQCDITDELAVQNLFMNIKNKHEKLDVVVNCAALALDNELNEKTYAEFMEVVGVNLGGTFQICKYASKLFEPKVIINMSSTDAQDTYSKLSMDYSASKAGVENLTKNLAKSLPNIRICALAPNWVDTESVLEMDPDYLKKELLRVNQKELLRKTDVALKIIEMIINDDYSSGTIVRMEGLKNAEV